MIGFLIITVLLHSYKVNSENICVKDSFCVCRLSVIYDQDYQGESVDCSYNNNGENILGTNFTLPPIVYSLDLSSNNISQLQPCDLLRSPTLFELILTKNVIKELKTTVFHLPKLKRLDLSNNLLAYIDKETFRDINKLEYLNLANNRLTTYTDIGFHHLSNLNELILNNNDLGKSLHTANLFERNGFGLTHKIQSLSISGVNLDTVPDNFFSEAYDIRNLVISHNNLKDTFEFPFTLEYLDLSDNPIEEISEEDFSDLPALKILKLNNLHIKEVPEYVFEPLHALSELELERNRNLTEFKSLAFGRQVLDDADDFLLERLSLKGSRLMNLNADLIEPFGRVIVLDLQGNPFQCDCELVWLKNLQIPPEYYEHLRCGSPRPFFNAKIFELDNKYLTCTMLTDHHIGAIIAFVTFCVILTGIGLWFFVFIPRYQSRGHCISSAYTPSAAYSMLPIQSRPVDL